MKIDADELMAIIAQGEGRQLEFKRGLPGPEKTARSLCAFANTRGGMLLVGVTDRGEVYGVERPREVRARLKEFCLNVVEPPVRCESGMVRVADHAIVWCSVPLSPERPHRVVRTHAEDEIVVRVGASNRRADGATLEALRRSHRGSRSLDALERRVLGWIEARSDRNGSPGGDATIRGFAQANNIGLQRARRAFTKLERDGYLVAHGFGAQRVFHLP